MTPDYLTGAEAAADYSSSTMTRCLEALSQGEYAVAEQWYMMCHTSSILAEAYAGMAEADPRGCGEALILARAWSDAARKHCRYAADKLIGARQRERIR